MYSHVSFLLFFLRPKAGVSSEGISERHAARDSRVAPLHVGEVLLPASNCT